MWYRLFQILIIVSLLTNCSSISSLIEDDIPVLKSNSFTHIPSESKYLKVVSYNIEKGHNVNKVLSTINGNDKLVNPDFLLLQEVSGDSIYIISENLSMNFVFYPSSLDIDTDKQYGNAVLSKYKIESSKKLLLPHTKSNGRRKVATIASVKIRDENLSIVSMHLETMVMRLSKRCDQLKEVVDYFDEENYKVIIGGDFNSFFHKDKIEFNKIMAENSFHNMTSQIGSTGSALGGLVSPKLDYIYGKGMKLLSAGRGPKNDASDHRAIWCLVEL